MKRNSKSAGRLMAWALALSIVLTGCAAASEPVPTETATAPAVTEQTAPVEATEATAAPETAEATTAPTETEPQPEEYMLTFAGDCTLGTDHTVYGASGTLVNVVGDDYSYPFRPSMPYFENDDFTLVNLEGVFSDHTVPEQKQFRFRAPPAYAKILTAGSVEAVNLANNHSYDYGYTGYADTKAALEAENVTYVENLGTAMYTTQRGLCIGLYAAQFYTDFSLMSQSVANLRAQGAQIVIVSYHGGTEGAYSPDSYQQSFARAAIDAGADIFYGHHPHVLQPIEYYKNGVIFYSLGNFAFGGNINPTDKDTVVIRQSVIREPDGTVHLGDTTTVPFCVSSVSYINDYMPTPYDVGSSGWERVMAKLSGAYSTGSTGQQETEPAPTTEATQPPTETTQPPEPSTEPSTEPPEPSADPSEPSTEAPQTSDPVTDPSTDLV